MLNERSTTGHAAIIGAGVMGAGIAAYLANIGWRVSLLDRVPEGAGADAKSRNRLVQEGLDRALKSRPPQFALAEYAGRVRVGNVEDHLEWLRDADWVVEAVAEDLEVKRALFSRIAEAVRPEAVISSNTSGLSLAGMVSGCPADFRSRFLGTHFFNPPRYMKPLELIPQAETDPEIFEGFVRFADRVLGKRVIRAKDTPGFISTRLGIFALLQTLGVAVRHGLTVEQTDYLTGPLIGRPKSGTFRLADLIGLDILANIRSNMAAALPADAAYQQLEIPAIVERLLADGRTGAKSGAGFYRREKSGEVFSLDLSSGEYRPRMEPDPVPAEIAALPLPDRLRTLWERSPSLDGGFVREALQESLSYIAAVTPAVADRIVEVDDALTGGFGWELGPYHTLDALPEFEWSAGIPAPVAALQRAGQPRFYSNERGRHFYFDFRAGAMAELERPSGVIILKDLKKAGLVVEEHDCGSLVDLGDGVLCAEWRTKMNTLDPEVTRFLERAREKAEDGFCALVLGGSSAHFSAGFNLALLLEKIEGEDWGWIDTTMADLQKVLRNIKYARVPVVAAVSGYALGGGCEVMLHTNGVVAAFESSIGLPEANVGLIPVAGGITRMLLRAMRDVPDGTLLEPADPFPALKPVWDSLRSARFSSSAPEARALGYLGPEDNICVNPDRLLCAAKERALSLAASYAVPAPKPVWVMGASGFARFRWEIQLYLRAGQFTEHDARIAEKLAWVLCGGDLLYRAEVAESYLLRLEREAFLSLAGLPESRARVRHMLDTGKPLRN